MSVRFIVSTGALAVACLAGVARGQGVWTQYAGGPERTGTLATCEFDPAGLAAPAWIAQRDSLQRVIQFVGLQTPMVNRRHVFAIGSVQAGTSRAWRLYAFNRRGGTVAWEAVIPAPVADSWSSAAVDERNRAVVVASGQAVMSFDMLSGALKWQCALPRAVVNASPCVTQDRVLANRVLITDSDGAGGGGSLYCINADQFVPGLNPFQPGAIVWSAGLTGTSGNTPAYSGGIVYVSSAGDFSVPTPGAVQAFDIAGGTQLWRRENALGEGCYGGVGIAREGGEEFVLATSYAFFGGTLSANTEKLRAVTGERLWSGLSNRSATVPVMIAPNIAAVCGGIQGFGSQPTLQTVLATGGAAQVAWSSLGTTRMGGWTVQPLFDRQHGRLYVGEVATSGAGFAAGIRMHVIDTQPLVTDGQLQEQVYAGFGSSPAIAGRNLYALGAAGLHAFGPVPVDGDVNGDGFVDVEDMHAYGMAGGFDVDGDGAVSPADYETLNNLARVDEKRLYYEFGRAR